jgi:hypothetical protein
MMNWLKKFAGLRVHECFLAYPSAEIHLTELTRNLQIAKGSAKSYCTPLYNDSLITYLSILFSLIIWMRKGSDLSYIIL